MASQYLTLPEFRQLTLLPPEFVDEVENYEPGFTLAQITQVSSLDVDGRLRKRYACPFEAPVPEAIRAWVTRIVSLRVLMRRGVNPTDPQFELIKQDATDAKTELLEAANQETGLWDLPLRDNTSATGIKGAPKSYSEASPYVDHAKPSVAVTRT